MWRIAFFAAVILALGIGGADAQTTARIGYAADGNGSQPFTYVSPATPLPVTGSFSAGTFAPSGSYATLTATAASADSALPTGTTVALFNTGTSAVSCILSVGAGVATASKNIIQPSSWIGVAVGSNTHYSCINQAGDGASNVVVASGGTGLPTGSGGGGGGSGGGAVYGPTAAGSAAANPPVLMGGTIDGTSTGNVDNWKVASGLGYINLNSMGGTAINSGCVGALSGFSIAIPSTVCGVFGSYVINTNANIAPADGAANPTTTSPVIAFLEGFNGTTWDRLTDDANKYLQVNVKTSTVSGQADPCFAGTKVNLPISQNGTSSVQLVGVSGSTTIYVCSLFLMTNSTATTVALTTGTGTACVTNNAAIIGTTTALIANSMNLIAGAGFTYGNASGYVAKGAASSELCMILGSNVYVSGNMTYVQQ